MPHLLPAIPDFPSESDLSLGLIQHSDPRLPAADDGAVFLSDHPQLSDRIYTFLTPLRFHMPTYRGCSQSSQCFHGGILQTSKRHLR